MKTYPWRIVAKLLKGALAACDWSFGRAQTPEVHAVIDQAEEAFAAKVESERKRAKRSRKS